MVSPSTVDAIAFGVSATGPGTVVAKCVRVPSSAGAPRVASASQRITVPPAESTVKRHTATPAAVHRPLTGRVHDHVNAATANRQRAVRPP